MTIYIFFFLLMVTSARSNQVKTKTKNLNFKDNVVSKIRSCVNFSENLRMK